MESIGSAGARERGRGGGGGICALRWRASQLIIHPPFFITQLPGFAGPPTAPPPPPGSAAAAAASARAAAGGVPLPVPGAAAAAAGGGGFGGGGWAVDEFLAAGGRGGRPPFPGGPADFEAAFAAASAGRAGPPPPPPFLDPTADAAAAAVAPLVRAFLASARAGHPPPPLPLLDPGRHRPPLPLAAALRLRDRATVVARQVYGRAAGAGGGREAAAAVDALLASAGVAPGSLPGGQQAAFEGAWGDAARQPPRLVAEHAAAAADAAARGRGGRAAGAWAGEFLHHHHLAPAPPLPPPGTDASWAGEFQQQHQAPGRAWAAEYEASTAARADAAGANAADPLSDTRALRDALASDPDPKVQGSSFLRFLSKMSNGEIVLRGNEAREVGKGAAWAGEFSGGAAAAAAAPPLSTAWAEEHASTTPWAGASSIHRPGRDWADEFAEGVGGSAAGRGWAAEFEQQQQQQAGHALPAELPPSSPPYAFTPGPNPFADHPDPLGKGRELFRAGVLAEAVLALEAAVQRAGQGGGNPAASPGAAAAAWVLLGAAHAENDDDRQAIAALARAAASHPGDPAVLLALGVSHTNELDRGRALAYLTAWLRAARPGGAAAGGLPGETAFASLPPDAALAAATAAFDATLAAAPSDADAAAALGVLRSLARDYGGAAAAFRAALAVRPADYSLWNKLGATLANAGSPGDAVAAYRKALAAKPGYVRAWTNLGIAAANLGDYDGSARFYTRSLSLARPPPSSAVWGYLRTSLACAGRGDLLEAADGGDVRALEAALALPLWEGEDLPAAAGQRAAPADLRAPSEEAERRLV